MEYILCAAIWYKEVKLKNPSAIENRGSHPYNIDNGIVICGWRHHCCILTFSAITGETDTDRGENVQGFLTSQNRFVNRVEGAKIAFQAGQIKEQLINLYSEDLY